MSPVLFKLGNFTIYTYGVFLAIGVICSIYLLLQESKRQGCDQNIVFDLAFVVLVSGIIGARLLYIILNIGFYFEDPKEIIMLHHGGLAIFGGFISGFICAAIYLRIKKISFLKIADLFSPFIALGHSIGRIGCFFNGCCYGKPSKFGIYFPSQKAVLIPAQIIESFLLLLLFIYLRTIQSRKHKIGRVLVSYLVLYSLIRFCVEFIRGDSEVIYFGLTIFQLFSIAFFIFGLIIYSYGRKKS